MVTELNEQTFREFTQQKGVVLVDCWAPWCGPCRRLSPIIDEIAQDLAGKVAVGKLNTDENQNLAARLGINAIPAMFFFKDGQAKEPLIGLRPKEEIVSYIESL